MADERFGTTLFNAALSLRQQKEAEKDAASIQAFREAQRQQMIEAERRLMEQEAAAKSLAGTPQVAPIEETGNILSLPLKAAADLRRSEAARQFLATGGPPDMVPYLSGNLTEKDITDFVRMRAGASLTAAQQGQLDVENDRTGLMRTESVQRILAEWPEAQKWFAGLPPKAQAMIGRNPLLLMRGPLGQSMSQRGMGVNEQNAMSHRIGALAQMMGLDLERAKMELESRIKWAQATGKDTGQLVELLKVTTQSRADIASSLARLRGVEGVKEDNPVYQSLVQDYYRSNGVINHLYDNVFGVPNTGLQDKGWPPQDESSFLDRWFGGNKKPSIFDHPSVIAQQRAGVPMEKIDLTQALMEQSQNGFVVNPNPPGWTPPPSTNPSPGPPVPPTPTPGPTPPGAGAPPATPGPALPLMRANAVWKGDPPDLRPTVLPQRGAPDMRLELLKTVDEAVQGNPARAEALLMPIEAALGIKVGQPKEGYKMREEEISRRGAKRKALLTALVRTRLYRPEVLEEMALTDLTKIAEGVAADLRMSQRGAVRTLEQAPTPTPAPQGDGLSWELR